MDVNLAPYNITGFGFNWDVRQFMGPMETAFYQVMFTNASNPSGAWVTTKGDGASEGGLLNGLTVPAATTPLGISLYDICTAGLTIN